MKYFKIGFVILAIVMLASGNFSRVSAATTSAQEDCERDVANNGYGGFWSGGFNQGTCADSPIDALLHCGNADYVLDYQLTKIISVYTLRVPVISSCHAATSAGASAASVNYGMRRLGMCKLVSIEDGVLGDTISTVVRGNPTSLKLRASGYTYELPVVPGSLLANGDGTYTAQFYTIDPVTGQALVPAGDYTARCHGANGSKDGGSANRVTIGY